VFGYTITLVFSFSHIFETFNYYSYNFFYDEKFIICSVMTDECNGDCAVLRHVGGAVLMVE